MTEFEKQSPSSPIRSGKLSHPARRAGDRVDEARVLAGGGDAGALMRDRDWSRTSLGPVAEWSEALRTMVGVLLRNRLPMMLLWGPQLIQLYNDAYRSILGSKHPQALGQPVREHWSEIWPIIAPLLEGPLGGRPATEGDDLLLLIDRQGFLEETHFKFGCSPVPDDTVESTGIGGVLATVAETTKQVYAERQLQTLRELGACAAEATTPQRACELAAATFAENSSDIPFALFYMAESDGKQARLAASCGFDAADGPDRPSAMRVHPTGTGERWPLRQVLETRSSEVVYGLRESQPALPRGRWSEPPREALCLPLAAPGAAEPYGVLIVGCNPHRQLDDGYRSFLELAAAQVAATIRSANCVVEPFSSGEVARARWQLGLGEQRREGERERQEYVVELQHTVRLAETFVNVIGHDLRNPLCAISTASALLSRRNESEAAMELIDLIAKSSEEMTSMLDQLVDFARLRLGHDFALAREDVDLAEVCELVIDQAEATHSCSISLDCTGDLLGYWDRRRLRQLITTLADNGCGHRSQGSTVSMRLDGSQAGSVTLEVWNEGVIEAERLEAVFELALQGPEQPRRAQAGGLGLGLYVGKQIVLAHEGTIEVESSEARGTRFLVHLPRLAAT